MKATNFTPLASEIIVYDPDENYDYPRIKIGDGKTNINSLPFVTKDYAKISDIPTKPEDIGALPDSTVIPTVPTKISAFENDKGYLTQHQSLDAYAKTADLGALATKDSLTASDVGALPDTTKIPSTLSDLTADSTHRTVTDTEKDTWNAKANTSDIPTKVSDLTNDKGYITSYTETDPTVPSWAKQPEKPAYTASEVGALPADTVIPTVPTKVSAFENDAGYLTEHQSLEGLATEEWVEEKIEEHSDFVAQPEAPEDINVLWIDTDDDNADSGGNVDLTGYATEQFVRDGYQPKGNYLTEHQDISGKADKNQVATYITPEMYGAKGDGSTDDSAAIQAAIDAAGSVSVVYLGAKKYKIGTGLVLTGTYKTLICDGWIVYSGEDAAITVKNAYRCKMNINTIDAANGTALKLDATDGAVYSNDFTIDVIRNSKIGIHLYTNGSHVSHNTLRNTYMTATDTGVRVWADSYYINENLWYMDWIGGTWQYGIHLHSDSALSNISGFGVNDNKFYSGSLEGTNTDSIPLLIDQSWGNYFKELRLAEGYGSTSVKMIGKCTRNDISLNHLTLSEVNISELGAGSVHNVLRCRGTNSDSTNFFIVGDEIRVSAAHGFTYIPDRYNYNVNVNSETFIGNIITHVGTAIPTAVTFQSATVDGATFTVGSIYSEHGSMTRGFPLSVRFGDGVGHVLLNDNKGNRIIDNRTGKYDGKVLSIRWCGFHNGLTQNIWSVQEIGGSVGAVDVTKLSQNVGFASDDYGVILESTSGNKYRVVTRDDGLLTTVAAADVNQVPLSTDTDGSIFNGTGYQNEKRISSGGEVKDATNGTASGFMPVKAGENVRFSGGRWETAITTNCVNYFNSSGKSIGYFTSQPNYDGIVCTAENSTVTALGDGTYQITTPDNENIAYLRLSMYGPNGAPGENMVVYIDGEKEQTPIVESVNGKTGAVVLNATDVGALPTSTSIPTKTSQLTNDSGFIKSYTETDPTVPAWAKAETKPSYSKSEVGLGNVDNVKQYSASNPPPYPVTSVNGKAGAVTLDAAAVGARPSTWTPSASDVGALPSTTVVPTKTSQLTNDSGFVKSSDIPAGAAATNTSPKMNGTAAVGSETAFARGDHVHPSDTSRVPTSRKVNGKALSADIALSASDIGALPSANYTTKVLTVTYEDGTSETVTLVVSK